METFLDKIASKIFTDFQDNFDNLSIILPNKRARVFLIEKLKNQTDKTFFAPNIISIEEFIFDISKIKSIDNIELLFCFYEVYKSLTPKENIQDFETFSNWAKMLLADFNEIDRYLLNPDHVFTYLKDIEDIKHWAVDLENRTPMIQKYLNFWEMMPIYYSNLYEYLIKEQKGYQGLIYREAVKNLKSYISEIGNQKIYFAGFNALNQAEEKIFQELLKNDCAKVFWDIDQSVINDPFHDAGLFARKIKNNWGYYKTHPFEWIVDEFNQEKNIQIISTPKSVGQAKITGKIIENISQTKTDLTNVAIVLSEENLLIPVLYSLPENVKSLNITMGYDSKSNPVQIFIQKWFKMHINALNRNKKSYTFYHKDVTEVLSHPLIENMIHSYKVVERINKNNLTFFSDVNLANLQENSNELFSIITEKWENNPLEITNQLLKILLLIKSNLNEKEDKLSLTFLYAIYKAINQLKNYAIKYDSISSPEQLFSIYKQIIEFAEVSFEGEPLSGLQIMGVLESRVLDFETVIITSLNEGKFPAGKTNNSFIPFDVKLELGLPTFKEKDAIYSYHFYHLLLRAKNIYLLHNSDSEGIDAGEKSRFITQIELDKKKNHKLKKENYYSLIPEKAYEKLTVEKSELLNEKLKNIATDKGFSPSALSNYLRNPMQFYFQRVLGINEVDEVEENVALNTLGTIIHNSLEELYKPFIDKFLTVENFDWMISQANQEITNQFNEVYSNNTDKLGKNLLAFEVAKRNIFHFLQMEKKAIEEGTALKILGLEQRLSYEIKDNRLPYPVKISGIVDRIEIRNNVIRIIDYKTGKVEKSNVSIQSFEGLTKDLKYEKVIQLLGYALMYQDHIENRDLQVAIYSFKNRKDGYLLFNLKEDKTIIDIVDKQIIEQFKEELIQLILDILNPEQAFIEAEI
ncbi:PD-(D/E)XK nuclease family protein [Paenimyroides tangerinum]|uniref:PD-(D/E)XK nuclease family protein n=1 Tax=Paenimyroides tangerinum TaxID=2488728 RepID=A0A3P3VZB9_9FLAO|nr:PD-(D/E)XK nuclease family protein [Paenimyroides tangerinum]RRJ88151.1 PD-(D/E)XK nuclease family protein [Paenimyroides tangerinum]